MGLRAAVLIGLALTLAGAVRTGADTPPPEMAQYFVGLIYRGEAWTPDVTDDVKELQKAHVENVGRLIATGEMALAGPFADDGDLRGLFFYDVETMEDAQRLVDSDPAVKAGRLRVELHAWLGPKSLSGLLAKK